MCYTVEMSIIQVDTITKTYGKGENAFDALGGVSLSVSEGESVAIIGKSGSGKSTLMHILALLDKPTSGQLFIDGRQTTKLKQRDINKMRNKLFGFVFQQFFMNARDTVLENVMIPLKIAGVKRSKRRQIVMEALCQVELEDKANSKASDLSGGQKQRVCIARALVNQPKIIFADEPTGNLDSATSEKVEEILFNLNKQGITLIIVTHDDELAAKCSRQIRIKDGVIIADSAEQKKGAKK